MFIRLTRLDNTPIWINACFVVTVEPRRAGGSIVVPIGDGLDYEVKETPEAVLGMLGDAPAPAVVPVPPPPGLAPKTLGTTPAARPEPAETQTVAPAKRTTRARSAKAKASEPGVEAEQAADEEAASDGKASAKKPRARRTKKSEEASPEEPSPEAAMSEAPEASEATEAALPAMPLSDDELVRLRKLAPGTVRKLQNTLKAQFRTTEPEAAVAALEAHGVLSLDRDHVIWR